MRIRQGDTVPFNVRLKDENNVAIDLTDADRVTFIMKKHGSSVPVLEGACTIVDETTGDVQYAWAEGDTDTIGMYYIVFLIEWNDGTQQTVPNHNQAFLWIMPSEGE